MTLEMKRENATTLVGIRTFASPPQKVFAAHTEPKKIKQWMLGPEGWSIVVCECEAVPGGAIAYTWREDTSGHEFSLSGEFLELDSPNRILHIERMHVPDATPDVRVETVFEPHGEAGTRMTIRMSVEDEATMDAMVASGMEAGMESSYGRIDQVGAVL